MAKNYVQEFNIINIKFLAEKTGIEYHKVRNCIVGDYGSWTDSEKTRLYNTIHDEVEKAVSVLGFTYEGRRIKLKD